MADPTPEIVSAPRQFVEVPTERELRDQRESVIRRQTFAPYAVAALQRGQARKKLKQDRARQQAAAMAALDALGDQRCLEIPTSSNSTPE